MKLSTVRKISLLGLVLVAASAVTAAILPKDSGKDITRGRLQLSTIGGGVAGMPTCVADFSQMACEYTAYSSTTAGAGTSSSDAGAFDNSSLQNSYD